MVKFAIDLTIEDEDGKEVGIETLSIVFGVHEPLTIIARESQFQFLSPSNSVSWNRAEVKRIEAWIE